MLEEDLIIIEGSCPRAMGSWSVREWLEISKDNGVGAAEEWRSNFSQLESTCQ